MAERTQMHAWRSDVPGVREVLHARMTTHAYPLHAHADWALMLVDEGAVVYTLGGRSHIADNTAATLLPPGVAHDGQAAPGAAGFVKRVAYLDDSWVSRSGIGAIVDRPTRADLLTGTRRAHRALATPGEGLAAEQALIELSDAVASRADDTDRSLRDHRLARSLRDLLESRLPGSVSLAEAGQLLSSHPSHLSRSFAAAFGLPPHRYVTGRRVDLARQLFISGHRPSSAAAEAGFHDQAHLTRHFLKVLGVTPARFRSSLAR
ncbi:AraC family transcriptional regulator [Microbacterium hatanonis]|nr:AraC family transcriptional regulator [Microbacterium hatanonis]